MGYLEAALAILSAQSTQIDAEKPGHRIGSKEADKAVLSPPGLDATPPRWRCEIADWPHAWWSYWRETSGRLQGRRGWPLTADEVVACDYQAYLETWAAMRADPDPRPAANTWRNTIAEWPIPRREALGRLANQLELTEGLSILDAEKAAFDRLAAEGWAPEPEPEPEPVDDDIPAARQPDLDGFDPE